ncbi:hypothetical protein J6590_049745 [Homalodisca vitripennis]|nr:hypothetical protein J6590_049745 [Homalodisca vitripennis]
MNMKQGTKSWGVSEVKETTELEPGAVCRITCFGRDCRYQWASQTKDQDKIVSCYWINNQDRYLQTLHF